MLKNEMKICHPCFSDYWCPNDAIRAKKSISAHNSHGMTANWTIVYNPEPQVGFDCVLTV